MTSTVSPTSTVATRADYLRFLELCEYFETHTTGGSRSLGGHLGPSRWPGMRTPRWRDQLCQSLARRADAEGRIHMTFEVVYGHAYKAAPKPGRGEYATVSLDSVRSTLRERSKGIGN